MAYEAIVFLQDDSDFDLKLAAQRLTKKLARLKVVHQGKDITVSTRDWSIRLHLADEPHVIEEARDMAKHFAKKCPRAAEFAKCKRRVEVGRTDPDPEMEHFNDYVSICEVAEQFKGVILFDPQTGELI